MDIVTLLLSIASSLVVASISYIGIFHRAKADLNIKKLEMREMKRQEVIHEFIRYVYLAIRSENNVSHLQMNFSPVLVYLSKEQSNIAWKLREAIEEKNIEKAKELLNKLCISLYKEQHR